MQKEIISIESPHGTLKSWITPLLGMCFWVSFAHHSSKLIIVNPTILQRQASFVVTRWRMCKQVLSINNEKDLTQYVRLTLSASTSEIISFISLPSCMLYSCRACSSSSIVMYLIMEKELDYKIYHELVYIFNLVGFIYFPLPAVIFIEILECSINMFFSVHSVHVHRCCDELVIIYNSITISICL